MKLVFYGGGEGADNHHLDLELFKLTNKPVHKIQIGYVPSCHAFSDQDFREYSDHYQQLGVKKILKIDADLNFSSALKKAILRSDIIHLGGGNTFYFLKQLKKSGLFSDIKKWVINGGVLSGLSAGGIIMTPNIHTAGVPSFDLDENEENLKNLKGMNLVDFEFFPHYKNSKRYNQELAEYSSLRTENNLYACRDGSGIIVNGDTITFHQSSYCFYDGKKLTLVK